MQVFLIYVTWIPGKAAWLAVALETIYPYEDL